MPFGLLVVGMGLGAVAALVWIAGGGSLLAALALYSLVGSLGVLAAALLAFHLSERRPDTVPGRGDLAHPAE